MPANYIAYAIPFLSIIAIIGAYLINIYDAGTMSCFPPLEGCVSISRAAREGDGVYLFRASMTVVATLLMIFWLLLAKWLAIYANASAANRKVVIFCGVSGALFLILYANFLGSDGAIYQLLRRYGITFFFALTILAQMLFVKHFRFNHDNNNNNNNNHAGKLLRLRTQFFVCCVLVLLLALTSVFMRWLQLDSDRSENILEWNVTIVILFFFVLSGQLMRICNFRIGVVCRRE